MIPTLGNRIRQTNKHEASFVNMSCRWEPVHLSCSGGLVRVSNWAPGVVALVAFKAKW